MFGVNAYRIRPATEDDAETLRRLAELNSHEPLAGRVLIGQYNGTTAALSLADGRVLAEPSRHTDHLVANLRMRADALRAYEATPALRDRLIAALPAWHDAAAIAAAVSGSRDGRAEHEPVAEREYALV
jgi:hypothetical protein